MRCAVCEKQVEGHDRFGFQLAVSRTGGWDGSASSQVRDLLWFHMDCIVHNLALAQERLGLATGLMEEFLDQIGLIQGALPLDTEQGIRFPLPGPDTGSETCLYCGHPLETAPAKISLLAVLRFAHKRSSRLPYGRQGCVSEHAAYLAGCCSHCMAAFFGFLELACDAPLAGDGARLLTRIQQVLLDMLHAADPESPGLKRCNGMALPGKNFPC